jgi:hypothetical protein
MCCWMLIFMRRFAPHSKKWLAPFHLTSLINTLVGELRKLLFANVFDVFGQAMVERRCDNLLYPTSQARNILFCSFPKGAVLFFCALLLCLLICCMRRCRWDCNGKRGTLMYNKFLFSLGYPVCSLRFSCLASTVTSTQTCLV